MTTHARSATLPDSAVTPGAGAATHGRRGLCPDLLARQHRKFTQAMKPRVYAGYGVMKDRPEKAEETDHLIPLRIGGSNDLTNIEGWRHHEVRTGKMTLADVQGRIATNWLVVHRQQHPAAKLPTGTR